jgi:hypothetical protein
VFQQSGKILRGGICRGAGGEHVDFHHALIQLIGQRLGGGFYRSFVPLTDQRTHSLTMK